MRVQAILFDLDGTLLDTLEDLADSVNHILGKYGFPLREKEEVRISLGNGSERLMRGMLPQDVKEEAFQKYLHGYSCNLL